MSSRWRFRVKSFLYLRERVAVHKRIWAALAVGLFLFGMGIWVWEEHLEDRLFPKRWGVVEAGKLYRSGQLSASLVAETLERYKIQTIINLRGGGNDTDARREREVARQLGIQTIHLPLKGNGTGRIEHYVEAIAHIFRAEKEGKPVLVHCAAGTQRTGGVVAAYRILVQGKSPRFIYAELQRYGWDPSKDGVLLNYLNGNMERLAELLVEKKVLDRVPKPLPVLGPEVGALSHG